MTKNDAARKARIVEMTAYARNVERMIVRLYSFQTRDEQASKLTSHDNGQGFGAFDAEFGTSLAQSVLRAAARNVPEGRRLTERQSAFAVKIVTKYWRQLADYEDATRTMVLAAA